jgi:hypothetical protein
LDCEIGEKKKENRTHNAACRHARVRRLLIAAPMLRMSEMNHTVLTACRETPSISSTENWRTVAVMILSQNRYEQRWWCEPVTPERKVAVVAILRRRAEDLS